jgi:hypothetical protein
MLPRFINKVYVNRTPIFFVELTPVLKQKIGSDPYPKGSLGQKQIALNSHRSNLPDLIFSGFLLV